MIRTRVLSLVLAAGLLMSVSAQVHAQEKAKPAPGKPIVVAGMRLTADFVPPEQRNAALRYWQAANETPTAVREAVREIDWDAVGKNLDADAMPESYRKAIALDSGGIVNVVLGATKLALCNWEINYEDGIGALLPHLAPMRTHARVLRLNAREALVKGDVERATEIVIGITRVGRHAMVDPVLICSLVGVAITETALNEADVMAGSGRLTKATRDRLVAALKDVDVRDPFRFKESVVAERSVFLQMVLRQATGPNAGKKLAEALGMMGDPNVAVVENLSESQIREDLDRTRAAYGKLIEALDAPAPEEEIARVAEEIKRGEHGLIASFMVPAIGKAYASQQKAITHLHETIERLEKAKVADEKK